MQMIWSRAAQARSTCRCASCLHSAARATVARRITAAAPRRQLKFGDVFTACYSAIFATAVVADTGVKENRRKQWDRAIAEAKAGLASEDGGPFDIADKSELALSEDIDGERSLPAEGPTSGFRARVAEPDYENSARFTTFNPQAKIEDSPPVQQLKITKYLLDRPKWETYFSNPEWNGKIKKQKVLNSDGRHIRYSKYKHLKKEWKPRGLTGTEKKALSAPKSQSDSAYDTQTKEQSKGMPKGPIHNWDLFEEDVRRRVDQVVADSVALKTPSGKSNSGDGQVKMLSQAHEDIVLSSPLQGEAPSSEWDSFDDEDVTRQLELVIADIKAISTTAHPSQKEVRDPGLGELTKQVLASTHPPRPYWLPDLIRGSPLENKIRELGLPIRYESDGEEANVKAEEWVEDEVPGREPLSREHLWHREQMVSKLVDNLLAHTTSTLSRRSWLRPSLLHNDNVQRTEMVRKIAQLRDQFTQLPSFSWSGDESVKEQRSALHRAILSLCTKAVSNRSSIELLVMKICYNLLISTSPPNIETYHILLYEFTKLRQHDLAQLVVDSYFNDSKFKTTQTTCALLLDHYGLKGDREGMRDIRRRMRGAGRKIIDMRICRRSLWRLKFPDVQEWALTHNTLLREGDLIEMSGRNNKVFDSLIWAALNVEGTRSAVRYARNALIEGRRLYGRTLMKLMQSIERRLDYKAGGRLLEALVRIWSRGDIALAVDISEEQVRSSLRRLIALSRYDTNHRTRKVPQDMFEGMLMSLRIESISKELDRSARLIDALEDVLASGGANATLEQQVDLSLHLLEEVNLLQKAAIAGMASKSSNLHSVTIESLEEMVYDADFHYVEREGELASILYDTFPPQCQSSYAEINSRYTLVTSSERFRLALAFHHALKHAGNGEPFWLSVKKHVQSTAETRSIEVDRVALAVAVMWASALEGRLRCLSSTKHTLEGKPSKWLPKTQPNYSTTKAAGTESKGWTRSKMSLLVPRMLEPLYLLPASKTITVTSKPTETHEAQNLWEG